jgi:hypothetical protein
VVQPASIAGNVAGRPLLAGERRAAERPARPRGGPAMSADAALRRTLSDLFAQADVTANIGNIRSEE